MMGHAISTSAYSQYGFVVRSSNSCGLASDICANASLSSYGKVGDVQSNFAEETIRKRGGGNPVGTGDT